MWRFEDPEFLLLLLPVTLIFLYFFRREKERKWNFTVKAFVEADPSAWKVKLRRLPLIFFFLSGIFTIFALARPQYGKMRHEIVASGIDMMLVLDASGSMKALDFSEGNKRKTRFQVAKEVIGDFIEKRKGDRMGLVVFGAYAYTQCPLTLDYALLRQFLDDLQVGVAGDSTALGDAIALAVKRLKDSEARSRIVIALTDGRNNAGLLSPEEAAEIAKMYSVKVYTIGIGKEGRSPFLVDSVFGKRIVFQQVELDERTLKKVAELTGGAYFRARSAKELEEVYATIDKLEKTQRKVKSWAEYNEKFRDFLLPGLIFSLAGFFLTTTLWRTLP